MSTPEVGLLGIDLGTSQVKALLCDRDGNELGRGIAGYSVRAPAVGWAEIDPEAWWVAVGSAVREAVAGASEIAAVAVVGQMHGAVLAGADGKPLRPAILWMDRRTVAEVEDYLRLPVPARAVLGNTPSVGMAGPGLLWVSRHEREVYERTRWLLQPKDWLRLRLTGEAAADPTDASGTLLYDMARGDWAFDVAGALGLRTDLLPPLRRPADVAGTLHREAADHLGLPSGLPVAVGAADTAASLVAAELPGDDWGLLTLGTGGQWVAPGAATATPDPATNVFSTVDGGRYRLAAAQNVGITLDWVRRILDTTWDDLYGTAAREWGPDVPFFLPSLVGERTDSRDGGAWDALSLTHRRQDLMRAAVEGVAFLLRVRREDLDAAGCHPAHVVVAGGGSRNPHWLRLLGEVLQRPLYPAATPWLTARGATIIAGVAAGLYDGWPRGHSIGAAPLASGATNAVAQERYRRFRALWG